MNKYPDEIRKFRPKGTVIKRINGLYYVYKATSKRVPGKSYPVQVTGECIGKIDNKGFIPLDTVRVKADNIKIRESGFTNYLLMFEDDYILNRIGNCTAKREKRNIFRNIIVYLSNNSYLNEDMHFKYIDIAEVCKKYDISLIKQITSVEKLINQKLADIEGLKYIQRIKINKKEFKSELTEAQKELIAKLGVTENDIR